MVLVVLYVKDKKYIKEIKVEVDIEDRRIQNKAGTDHKEVTKVTDDIVETEAET